MSGWLVENLGPDAPLHFSRFHPQHKLTHLPPTPVDTLIRARDVARTSGLRYVYLGNVRGVPDAETTFCPNCGRAVVERDIFAVTTFHVEAGRCKFCQTKVAGVWTV
jgi:pyruvate formate lyase activating enzyme